MFTGIIERRGVVLAALDRPGGRRIEVRPEEGKGIPDWEPAGLGESIALNGVCLTAAGVGEGGRRVSFDVVPETLRRTTLGGLAAGARVNLERSLRVGDRLGGHFVSGHVDGLGEVVGMDAQGDQILFRIAVPQAVAAQVILKGSVAVDGISLTVVGVDRAGGWFSFAAVPHTLAATTLGERRPGDAVNIECDQLGKWVLHGLREAGLVPGWVPGTDLPGVAR